MIHFQGENSFLVWVGAMKIMRLWICIFIERRQFLLLFQVQKNMVEEKDKFQISGEAIL